MKIIATLYRSLVTWITNLLSKNNNTKNIYNNNLHKEYVGSLSFFLTKNKDIDISYSFLDLDNYSLEELSLLSEMYAEFIIYINEGFLQEDIIRILKEKHKNKEYSHKPKNKLFIDNIIFNWTLLHSEYNKKNQDKESENSPLIRPISVFNPIK